VLTLSAHCGDLGGGCLCGPEAPKTAYGIYDFSFRASAGAGYVPVVLLWPEDEGEKDSRQVWLEGGEVDVLELEDGDRQRSTVSLHYFDPWGSENEQRLQQDVNADFTKFHRVQVVFEPSALIVSIDGQEAFRENDPARIPPRPMHFTAQIDLHWDPSRQPDAAAAEAGTQMQISDLTYRPIRGVTLNPDGSPYTSVEPAGTVLIVG